MSDCVAVQDRGFLLQRAFLKPGALQWRVVQRFRERDSDVLLEAADKMGRVGSSIVFRVVADDKKQAVVLTWNDREGWK